MKEIIQKNGKYWKECDIVMLSANNKEWEKGEILITPIGSLIIAPCDSLIDSMRRIDLDYKPQNLYILSNEQIPYNPNGGTNGLFLCLHELEHPEDAIVKNVGNCTGCRKIIASTDVYLRLPEHEFSSKTIELPKLSEDFIKKYVESNDSIQKVLVEYEGVESIIEQRINTIHTFEYKLKLNPDNTINILLIEDSLEEAAKNYAYSQYGNSCGAKEERKYCIEDFKAGAKWQKNQLNNQ